MHLKMYSWIVTAFILLGASSFQINGCGIRPHLPRVVNGEDAVPNSWPWQISLRVNGRHICGGSLIKPDWVITAAHCLSVWSKPSSYEVVVGAHKIDGTTAVQKTYKVTHIIKHKGFTMKNLQHDVGLIKLQHPIVTSDKVNTICLPDKNSRVAPGTQCYITGWGRTVGGGKPANVLQQALLPVVKHKTCREKYGKVLKEKSMLCGGGQDKGGCQGDSGGPFVCEEGGKFVLRGAVSFGMKFCNTKYPTVFARVSSYIGWINRNISGQ